MLLLIRVRKVLRPVVLMQDRENFPKYGQSSSPALTECSGLSVRKNSSTHQS